MADGTQSINDLNHSNSATDCTILLKCGLAALQVHGGNGIVNIHF